jgi:hypothetical protein
MPLSASRSATVRSVVETASLVPSCAIVTDFGERMSIDVVVSGSRLLRETDVNTALE